MLAQGKDRGSNASLRTARRGDSARSGNPSPAQRGKVAAAGRGPAFHGSPQTREDSSQFRAGTLPSNAPTFGHRAPPSACGTFPRCAGEGNNRTREAASRLRSGSRLPRRRALLVRPGPECGNPRDALRTGRKRSGQILQTQSAEGVDRKRRGGAQRGEARPPERRQTGVTSGR